MAQQPLFLSLLLLLLQIGYMAHDTAIYRQPVAQGITQTALATDDVTAPRYPGGESELLRYLALQMRYPTRAHIAKVAGRVVMQVTIDEAGRLGNVAAAYSDNALLNLEPMRVLKLMPGWEPARKAGVPVSCTYLFPFRFRIAGAADSSAVGTKDALHALSEKLLAAAPDQPVYMAEEVTVTGLGVGR